MAIWTDVGCMDGCMYISVLDGRLIDRWRYGWVLDGWISGWMDGCVGGGWWVGGWMGGWMDGWMDAYPSVMCCMWRLMLCFILQTGAASHGKPGAISRRKVIRDRVALP